MRAAVFQGSDQVVIQQIPDPVPGPGEVRVKVAYCAVTATDISLLHAGAPVTPGSEVTGVIDALGAGVSGQRQGQRVFIYTPKFCGNCPHCWSGMTHVCPNMRGSIGRQTPGGFAEYIVVPDRNAIDLPAEVELAEGVLLLETLGATGHGLRQAMRVTKDTSAPTLILGFDGLGMGTALLLKARGYKDIAAVDLAPGRQQLARDLGLNEAHAGWRYPLVIETSGRFDYRMRALREVDAGGAVLFLGENDAIWPVTPDYQIRRNDFFAVHTFTFPLAERRVIQDDLRTVRKDAQPLLAERRPLDQLGTALAAFANGELLKPLIVPGEQVAS